MKRIIVASFLLFVVCMGTASAASLENIFEWSKEKMEVTSDVKMPVVKFVTRKVLVATFVETTSVSEELLKVLNEELLGVFIVASNLIFIVNNIGGVKRDSIVAHEFIHFLDEFKNGAAAPDDIFFGFSEKEIREMRATKFEKLYLEERGGM